jgi:hypothetical protein
MKKPRGLAAMKQVPEGRPQLSASLVSVRIDSFVYCDCDQDNHTAHGVLNVRRDQKDIHQIAQ